MVSELERICQDITATRRPERDIHMARLGRYIHQAEGDDRKQAIDRLVMFHMPLAIKFSRSACQPIVRHFGYTADDIVQECYLALLDAANKWNPDRGTFAFYGWFAMRSRLADHGKGLIARSRGHLTEVQTIDLHAPTHDSGPHDYPDMNVFSDRFTGRTRDVYTRYMGLEGHEPLSKADIGRKLGMSRKRVSDHVVQIRRVICDHLELPFAHSTERNHMPESVLT